MRPIGIVFAIVIFGIACSALLSPNTSFADTAAIRSMADITMNLKHLPSDSDKRSLAAIASSSDSSKAEVAVATAISNFEHKVADADKEKLNSVIADESTPAELRELAKILLGMNHSPGEADMEKLERIAAASDQ